MQNPRRIRWHGVEDKLSQMSYKEPKWLLVIMTMLLIRDIDDYDGNNKTYDDDHKYADDNGEANYEDDDNSAKYDDDDCNVRIISTVIT